jgi:hypothetical protein
MQSTEVRVILYKAFDNSLGRVLKQSAVHSTSLLDRRSRTRPTPVAHCADKELFRNFCVGLDVYVARVKVHTHCYTLLRRLEFLQRERQRIDVHVVNSERCVTDV